MNSAGQLRTGWWAPSQSVHTSRVATRILIGYLPVSRFVRGSPRGPIMTTCQVEMKPGDFLKAVSFWDGLRPNLDVNHEFGTLEPAGLV